MKSPSLSVLLVAGIFVAGLSLAASAQSGQPPSAGGGDGPARTNPEKPTHTDNRDEFTRMDLDGDGKISPQEYASSELGTLDLIAAGKRSGSEAPGEKFNLHQNENRPDRSEFFRRLDIDHDGYLSRSEVAAAHRTSSDAGKR